MTDSPEARRIQLIVLLAATALAASAGCAFLYAQLVRARGGAVFYGEEALRDPELRREVVRKLTEGSTHPFDSHPDADVGRVLIADGERGDFRTNAIGMRGASFELEKPEGVVRLVLLGDSYVFGLNVAEEERVSEVLARELTARAADPKPRFECLNLAVNSWNLVAECAFLRRQVDRLRPDLVLQVTHSNDLDDVTGVRGFGAEASFAPRHSGRGDGIVMERHAQIFLQRDTSNLLPRGLDWEGRTRFAEALAAVQGLRTALGRRPESPAHLLVVHWNYLAPAFHAHLGAELEPDSVLYLPLEYASDKSLWITAADPHWNAQGHARLARLLYGAIRSRGLLRGVTLAPWPEAERVHAEEGVRGLTFARENDTRLKESLRDPAAEIDCAEISLEEARQIYGGVDREGLVAPYASLTLHRPLGARVLRLVAQALPDLALEGARVRVFLEEFEFATLELRPGAELELRRALPAELADRPWLNLRFTSDDFVYRGSDQRHCVVFRLQRVALE
jgi:hypothetical protein